MGRGLGVLALAGALLFVGAATAAPIRHIAPGIDAGEIYLREDGSGPVTGELIKGAGKGLHPAVLFVHWLGDPKTTNHTEFEADAVALAKRGITSLLVDAMWAKPDWFDKVGVSADADVAQAREQIAELRAALDALQALKGVDRTRIAYVGHDFGAMFGALLAGEDARPKVYVLMAGVPTMSEWYLLGKKHPDRDAYVAALDRLDITGSLARSKARAILFQFAAHDHYITAERAAAFAATAPLPRGVFTYDADHSLAVPQAAADRRAWLIENLAR